MAKTAKFELIGQVVGHPEHGDLQRGDVLTLEVGDDNLPKAELFRSRTRPLGRSVEDAGDVGKAEAQAAKIIEDAEGEALLIVEAAKAEAAEIVAKANKK